MLLADLSGLQTVAIRPDADGQPPSSLKFSGRNVLFREIQGGASFFAIQVDLSSCLQQPLSLEKLFLFRTFV